MNKIEKEERAINALIAASLRNLDFHPEELDREVDEAMAKEPMLTFEQERELNALGKSIFTEKKIERQTSEENALFEKEVEQMMMALNREKTKEDDDERTKEELNRKREELLRRLKEKREEEGNG